MGRGRGGRGGAGAGGPPSLSAYLPPSLPACMPAFPPAPLTPSLTSKATQSTPPTLAVESHTRLHAFLPPPFLPAPLPSLPPAHLGCKIAHQVARLLLSQGDPAHRSGVPRAAKAAPHDLRSTGQGGRWGGVGGRVWDWGGRWGGENRCMCVWPPRRPLAAEAAPRDPGIGGRGTRRGWEAEGSQAGGPCPRIQVGTKQRLTTMSQ